MINTGEYKYDTLVEYYEDNNEPTGNTKPNTEGDQDYVPPVDRSSTTCPVPSQTELVFAETPENACAGGSQNTNVYYTDNPLFYLTKKIYTKSGSVFRYASPGYYSNNFGVLYFDGQNVTQNYQSCSNF